MAWFFRQVAYYPSKDVATILSRLLLSSRSGRFCTHHLSSFSTMHYFCLLQAYVVVVNDVTRCIYSSVTVCCGVFSIQDKQFYVHDEQPLKSLSGLFGQLVFLDCLYFKLFNYLCVDLALYIIYICKFLLFQ